MTPSTEFEAVSNTPDPTTTYTIYSWDTSDTTTSGCPCFGDYDKLGADDNGIYVATDEFGIDSGAFNGVIIYAISKEQIETASGTGILPACLWLPFDEGSFRPALHRGAEQHPSQTRSSLPNTEYFVESNSNLPSDDHLLVYALNDTSDLGAPGASGAVPDRGDDRVVRIPAGCHPEARSPSAREGVSGSGREVSRPTSMPRWSRPTSAASMYAELDTGTKSGSDAVDWFILRPTLSGSTLSASLVHQGVRGGCGHEPDLSVHRGGRRTASAICCSR